ncbi:MAG: DUF2306 domain-containing protein [Cocleimonas sp.]|nr:DUF2306 domain-containing protein [Cocleimonas sp.]
MLSSHVLVHLIAASIALLLGAVILMLPKGTLWHKRLGRVWAVALLVTAMGSFWIQTSGQFSPIHLLSVVSLISLFIALYAIKRGDTVTHRGAMLGGYIGLCVAFLFTFIPDRLVGQFFWRLF